MGQIFFFLSSEDGLDILAWTYTRFKRFPSLFDLLVYQRRAIFLLVYKASTREVTRLISLDGDLSLHDVT
jgi:hypothetical protein